MEPRATLKTLEAMAAASEPDLSTIYLFGSFARGEAGPASDLDVAVLFAKGAARGFGDAASRLAATWEERFAQPVDVVDLEKAPVDLTHRVLRDGRLLLDRDPSRRIRFEVAARNRYWDILPFLRRYRGLEARP